MKKIDWKTLGKASALCLGGTALIFGLIWVSEQCPVVMLTIVVIVAIVLCYLAMMDKKKEDGNEQG